MAWSLSNRRKVATKLGNTQSTARVYPKNADGSSGVQLRRGVVTAPASGGGITVAIGGAPTSTVIAYIGDPPPVGAIVIILTQGRSTYVIGQPAMGATAALVFTAATWSQGSSSTMIPYDTSSSDPFGMFNVTTHKFTPPMAGTYSLDVIQGITGTAANERHLLQYALNGSTATGNLGSLIVTNSFSLDTIGRGIIPLNAGDTIGVISSATAGSTVSSTIANSRAYFRLL